MIAIKEQEKPLLVAYDEAKHKTVHGYMVKFAKDVEAFKIAFNDFANEIGLDESFTPDLLTDVLNFGRRNIEFKIDALVKTKDKPLKSYYAESYYADLKKLDPYITTVTGWRLKNSIVNEVPIELWQPENFKWDKNNNMIIDNRYFESIKDHFTSYMTTDVEKETWRRYEAIAEAWNEFHKYAKENNVYTPGSFSGLFGMSYETHRAVISANPAYYKPFIKTK